MPVFGKTKAWRSWSEPALCASKLRRKSGNADQL
jgi:hypothetical protein